MKGDINTDIKNAAMEWRQSKADLAYLKVLYPSRGVESQKAVHKHLYFIGCGDAVKIGVSNDPEQRMIDLSTGAPGPLKLLASFPGKGGKEGEYHKLLKHIHLHGEWFRHTYEVDSLIKELQYGQ